MSKAAIGSEDWLALDRAFDRAEKQLARAIAGLGLSPVTRSKVSRTIPAPEDPMGKFKRKLVVFPGGGGKK
jgi:hypothetical protein